MSKPAMFIGFSKLTGVSVVIAWSTIYTASAIPWFRANISLHTMTAAAPQDGGHAIKRVRLGYINGAAVTSLTVTGIRNIEKGLLKA